MTDRLFRPALVLSAAMFILVSVQRASAQIAAKPAAVAGALTGVVIDSAGRGVDDASVLLYQTKGVVRTRSDGSFRFDDVNAGKYTLEVRHIGYKAVTSKITVKDDGLAVTIKLERVPFFLPSVLTQADRGGLSGVISDTSYKPMSKVRVTVMGANASAETDSAGAFFMPVKPGHYMVEIKRDGYARQLVGVTVPEQTGRKLAAWMVPQKNADPREGAMLFDLPHRVNIAKVIWDKFYTREDMEAIGIPDVRTLGSTASMKLMSPDCRVYINGDFNKWVPVWSLKTADVEFVEVHIGQTERQTGGPTGNNGGGSREKLTAAKAASGSVPAPESSDCPATIIAWLRR